MASGVVTTQGSNDGLGFLNPTPPKYGTVPYRNVDPAKEPPGVNFSGGTGANDLISQMKFLMGLAGSGGSGSNSLNYALYTPQEMAQRGLAMNGSNRGALDAQGNYIGTQEGYIGQQSAANQLKNQMAGLDIGQAARQAQQKAAADYHSAQGSFAANGASTSDMARQTLGQQASGWKDLSRTPWMGGDFKGDINRGRDDTLAGLYRQLVSQNADYGVAQGGLYTQLAGLGAQRAQLGPQYLGLGQGDDAYNRLLNGQYNTNVSPELRALMSALSQAGG